MRAFLHLPLVNQQRILLFVSGAVVVMQRALHKFRVYQVDEINQHAKYSDDIIAEYKAAKQRQDIKDMYDPLATVLAIIPIALLVLAAYVHLRYREDGDRPVEPVQPNYRSMGFLWGAGCGAVSLGFGFIYFTFIDAQIRAECKWAACSKEELKEKLDHNDTVNTYLYRSFIVLGAIGMHKFNQYERNPEQAPRWLSSAAHYLQIVKPVAQTPQQRPHRE